MTITKQRVVCTNLDIYIFIVNGVKHYKPDTINLTL